MEPTKEQINDCLVQLKQNKITYPEICEYVGVTPPTITKWKWGQLKHRPQNYQKLMKLFEFAKIKIGYEIKNT